MPPRKIWILGVLLVLLATFVVFDLGRFLSLEYLKAQQHAFAALYAESPRSIVAVYFGLYVLVTALSLPGAAIMTLAGGAIFGLSLGMVVVSFASSIGATLAFLASRYVLRDSIQRRFGARFVELNRGMEREGAFYLFTLRLVPLIPFFVINLVMGLTNLPVRVFYVVSQLGMLAGTVVFVNAGTQLAKLESVRGILSPALLGSFVALGVFPLIAKKVVGLVHRRRVYSPWRHLKPKRFDRNLVVIGAGAAGLVTSHIGAAVKAKVTLVEAHKMGGDCLNYGCVPSKSLIKSAAVVQQMRDATKYGLARPAIQFKFAEIMERIAGIIAKIEPHDSVARYTELGVEVLQGYAKIVNPWTVDIAMNDGTQQRLTTRNIVIATGGRPLVPDLPGLQEVGYLTSDTVWEIREQPQRLVVLGGGPIGCELAQCFARLGSQVMQVQRAPRLLMREDKAVSIFAQTVLEGDGVTVLTNHEALRCERVGEQRVLIVRSNGIESRIEFDRLLCAAGREARLSGYGLEELGLAGPTLATNDYLETRFPNILACGDVASPYQFTHVAAHQAWYAAVNALFGTFKKFKADYRVIPWTTFIDPEIARVGLNELEAKAQGISYEVTRYGLDELDRALTDSAALGFIQVLTVPGKDRILGVTIVGSHAGELLAEYVLAMKHGLGLNKILGTIHTYPTFSEANKYVAGAWKRNHQPHVVLKWIARYHAWRRG
ncbi:MAG: pyridine nucleotide-disulfide oxidoreductase [Gammaproteobacteria bacterium]|nr:pyridine nucleotide-disulfide oxidoreductase [Gammaproteobacteria bacterium]